MKRCMSFTKGMVTGIATGMAIAVAVKCVCLKSRKCKKYTNRAARTVSGLMEDIQELLK